jgi:hypothetical protein
MYPRAPKHNLPCPVDSLKLIRASLEISLRAGSHRHLISWDVRHDRFVLDFSRADGAELSGFLRNRSRSGLFRVNRVNGQNRFRRSCTYHSHYLFDVVSRYRCGDSRIGDSTYREKNRGNHDDRSHISNEESAELFRNILRNNSV